MRRACITLAVAAATALQGCALAPAYQQPDSPVPDAWPQGQAYPDTLTGGVAADLGWRTFLRDPVLQDLVKTALRNNRDLKVAALNVQAYQAQYRIQRADLLPALGAEAAGTRQRLPADLSQAGVAGISSQYSVGATLSYELDFFGRIRSLNEQALESYLATAQAQRNVHIGLVASLAQSYLTWQADRALLELTRETLDTYEQTLKLMQDRHQAGASSALDVQQAATAVDSATAQIQRYIRQVAQDENALAVLVGTKLPPTLKEAQPLKMDTQPLAPVPVGLPSELLLRRPDILQAEHRLKAANANIGAAKAAFFPSISLTGQAGTASAAMGGLFEGGSGMWNLMPQITIPIFNAGRLRASLDYAEISKEISVAEYEAAIQNAFREVADSLAAQGTYGKQLQAQQKRVENTHVYVSLAQQRYDAGVESYLTVLDAQRELYDAQNQQIQDRLAQLNSEITLYKALGGGWLEAMPQPDIASQQEAGNSMPAR